MEPEDVKPYEGEKDMHNKKRRILGVIVFGMLLSSCAKEIPEGTKEQPTPNQIQTGISGNIAENQYEEEEPEGESEAQPTEMQSEEQTKDEQPEKEKMAIADILEKLQAVGVVSASPKEVQGATAEGQYVSIERVETYTDAFVIVTLDAFLVEADAEDIVLKKYSDDWYALRPDVTEMVVTESYVTVNDEGKSVIIYAVDDAIEGYRAVTDTSERRCFNMKLEKKKADNFLSWQMDNGGWDKKVESQEVRAWDGTEKKNKFSTWVSKSGEMVGTIDNEATYTQMRQIAMIYREIPEQIYQDSVLKGLEFVFKLQEKSGAFAQCYPRRGGYSDAATFNDNAMINVLIMLEDMRERRYPFDSDIIPEEYIPRIEDAINRGIDFILKSQVVSNGKLTAWCAQHDPVTYEPVGARAYELPSISGSESVAIVKFLMNQEQTPEIRAAVEAAINWFKESEVKDMKYVGIPVEGKYFVPEAGSSLWYRFYEIDTNLPIFCDRDGIKKHDIAEIGSERRNGYSWSGTYPKKLLEIYDTCGYYKGRIEVTVAETASVTSDGKALENGSCVIVQNEITEMK